MGNSRCTPPKAAPLSSFEAGQACYSNCVSDTSWTEGWVNGEHEPQRFRESVEGGRGWAGEDEWGDAWLEESETDGWNDDSAVDSVLSERARWTTCFRCKVLNNSSMYPGTDSTSLGWSGCYSSSARVPGGCWAQASPASFVLLGRGNNAACGTRDR